MIDEFLKSKALPAAKRTSRNFIRNTKKALGGFGAGINNWFTNFRWVEFTAAIGAAFAAGTTMASSLMLSDAIGRKIGILGAALTAVAFIRSPKTKWETSHEPDAPEE